METRILDAFIESCSTCPESPPLRACSSGTLWGHRAVWLSPSPEAGLSSPAGAPPLSPLPFSPALGNRESTCHFEGFTSFLRLPFRIIGIKQYEVVL